MFNFYPFLSSANRTDRLARVSPSSHNHCYFRLNKLHHAKKGLKPNDQKYRRHLKVGPQTRKIQRCIHEPCVPEGQEDPTNICEQAVATTVHNCQIHTIRTGYTPSLASRCLWCRGTVGCFPAQTYRRGAECANACVKGDERLETAANEGLLHAYAQYIQCT